jgi:hypothetical protein
MLAQVTILKKRIEELFRLIRRLCPLALNINTNQNDL